MLLRKKEDIKNWLDSNNVENYEIIEDEEYGYVVNVNDNVNLNHKGLESIDVKFNEINGNFLCSNNRLKTLEGCPKIVNGKFACIRNELKTLEYGPEVIGENYFCANNLLISLKGAPNIINGNFDCSNNLFKTLEYLPKKIGNLYIVNSLIENLEGLLDVEEACFVLITFKNKEKNLLKNEIELESNVNDLNNLKIIAEKQKIINDSQKLLNQFDKELNKNKKNNKI